MRPLFLDFVLRSALVNRLADRVRGLLRRQSGVRAHPFDVRWGVDTSGLKYADRLVTGHEHDEHSEGYYATAPSLFEGAMRLWMSSLAPGARVEDYRFIDLGCGKGRVVMMASEYPFRGVIGIELHAGLAGVARRNLRRWARAHSSSGPAPCRDVQVIEGDVLGRVPELLLQADGPVVLFLFNAFGMEVLGPLLERLAAAPRAGVDLIYVHPDHDRLVTAAGAELVGYGEVRFSEEDAAADAFGVGSDVCSVWRFRA